MRLAVIFHRLGPYHCARLEAAGRIVELNAIELSSETKEYAWSKIEGARTYRRVTAFPEGDSRAASASEVSSRVRTALSSIHPELVAIPGWSDGGALAALQWCIRSGAPAILMSESSGQDEKRVEWKEWIKRRMVALYSTALVGGEAHAHYLMQLGMRREQIFFGYDVVDNDYFARETTRVKGQRAKLGGQKLQDGASSADDLPDNFFLASARFMEKKNLFRLLRAYAGYRKKMGPNAWRMVLLGDGPLRKPLEAERATLGLERCLEMPGFKQYEELPSYYAHAKAFVHASTTEQWGLVVNEAIASGLPVIISNRCGCVPELVHHGVNGFTFDPYKQDELTDQLVKMASLSEGEREGMASSSRKIAAMFEPARFAKGLRAAAELAVNSPKSSATLVQRLLLRLMLCR